MGFFESFRRQFTDNSRTIIPSSLAPRKTSNQMGFGGTLLSYIQRKTGGSERQVTELEPQPWHGFPARQIGKTTEGKQ